MAGSQEDIFNVIFFTILSILGLLQALKSSVEVSVVCQSNLILAVTIFISITGKEKLLLNNELQSLFMLLFTL